MTLKTFLELYKGGLACVSIQQMPYDYDRHRYAETYFEAEEKEEIMLSDTYKRIANKQVDHFNILDGAVYNLELSIYLKE